MYITYRNLSQLVHPSAVTFARYMGELPHARLLSTRLQVGQNAEPSGSTSPVRRRCAHCPTSTRWTKSRAQPSYAPRLWLLMSPQPSTSTGLWTDQASWAAGEPHGRGVPPPIGAVLLPDLSKSGRCPIDYPCIDADDYSPNQPYGTRRGLVVTSDWSGSVRLSVCR